MIGERESTTSQIEHSTEILEQKITEQCDDLIALWSLEVRNNIHILKDKVEEIHKFRRKAEKSKNISFIIITIVLFLVYCYFTYFQTDSIIWDFIK